MIKNITCLTFAVTSTYVFSFRKMSEVIINKINVNTEKVSKLVPENNKSILDQLLNGYAHINDSYYCHIYDEKSKYGFYTSIPLIQVTAPNLEKFINTQKKLINTQLNVIKPNPFNKTAWKNSFISGDYKNSALKCFCFINSTTNDIKKTEANVFNEANYNTGFLENFEDKTFKISKNYISPSGIKITNTPEGVKLSKILPEGANKPVDFQEALNKYFNRKNISSTKNSNELENTKELLKNSEILAIWHFVPSHVTFEKNGDFNKKRKISNLTQTYCTFIGYGVNQKNNMPFYWVTELAEGDDIETLLEN